MLPTDQCKHGGQQSDARICQIDVCRTWIEPSSGSAANGAESWFILVIVDLYILVVTVTMFCVDCSCLLN